MFLFRLAPGPEKVEGIWQRPPPRAPHEDLFLADLGDGLRSQRWISGRGSPRRRGPKANLLAHWTGIRIA